MDNLPKAHKGKGSRKLRRSAKHRASGKYLRQRDRTYKNKRKRLQVHLDNHPNDNQPDRKYWRV